MTTTAPAHEMIIGGHDLAARSQATTPDVNPYTGTPMATVPAAGPEDVDAAVAAAHGAFDGWAATPPGERRRLLLRAADLLEARREDAAATLTAETGATRSWADFNVTLAAEFLRQAAAVTSAALGEVLPSDVPGTALSMTVRRPAGVVASLVPWNAPIILCTRAVATPIALGNTVVIKPSENAPLSAGLLLADVAREAGFPDGVVNCLTNAPDRGREVTEALIADRRVRRVNFTGSTAVGRSIARVAGEHLTPVLLELGGKNSLIVLADADLDHAVDAVAFGAYFNSGQICMSTDRVLVDRAVVAEYSARLAARVAGMTAGDPTDPDTRIGPVIDTRSAQRIRALVDEAGAGGATVTSGTTTDDRVETLLAPTVLGDVTPAMRVHEEEVFGPVCSVLPVDGPDEAVAVTNASPYGLTAGVITHDAGLGLAVAGRLDTGIVHVNDQTVGDEPYAPFGGVKDSGYGRFGGIASISEFTDLRWITVGTGRRDYPI